MIRIFITSLFLFGLPAPVAAEFDHGAGTGHATGSSPAAAPAWPDRTVIPFELAERLIVVQASVNGVAGNFLLDSGAPTLVLNRGRFRAAEITTRALNHATPSGAGGAMQDVAVADGLTLELSGLVMQDQRALVADLTHLAENVGVPLVGLIGQSNLEPFQVQFDYANRQLTFLRLGADNRPVATPAQAMPALVVDMEMHGHIPVLPITIGAVELRMGLDSGAAGALLFTRWREPLSGHYTFLRRDAMKGADTAVHMGDVVQVDRMRLAGTDYDGLTFRFNDIGGAGGHQPPFDGLLGYEFLAARVTAINFRARQLLVWGASG